ncbi:MAG: nucleotidyltransferase family protein [Candidatus Solibacter usitatus]|nr:nucleotidyltransferase family protein [Candidatus Solibacter usitatus]
MTIAATIEIPVEALADLCRRYQVKELSLFGSAAREELRPDSDIDILVEFVPNHTVDIFDFGHLEDELRALLGRSVDLVSRKGMNPRVAPFILRDARRLYAP